MSRLIFDWRDTMHSIVLVRTDTDVSVFANALAKKIADPESKYFVENLIPFEEGLKEQSYVRMIPCFTHRISNGVIFEIKESETELEAYKRELLEQKARIYDMFKQASNQPIAIEGLSAVLESIENQIEEIKNLNSISSEPYESVMQFRVNGVFKEIEHQKLKSALHNISFEERLFKVLDIEVLDKQQGFELSKISQPVVV